MVEFNIGETDAPENREKVYITPGFRKLTIEDFSYTKEDDGKTPLIEMNCVTKEGDDEVKFTEKLYISGKLNKNSVMSSITRLQELFKGLTGDKITIKPSAYTYTKKEQSGESVEYTIPNPQELCDFLNKKCAGKSSIFKVGGEEAEDGTVYSKLTYSGFLYYTDRQGNICKYKEERDFTDSEKKFSVQKRKSEGAPVHSGGVADTKTLDDL